jgi:hypothetical protein
MKKTDDGNTLRRDDLPASLVVVRWQVALLEYI